MKRTWNWCRNVIGGFLEKDCLMNAAGLTYFALMALVPILCVILFTAKTCGVHDYAHKQINLHLDQMITQIEQGQDDKILAVLGPGDEEERQKKRIAATEFARQARTISNGLFERIEKFDVGTLGWIGFATLLWTVISTIGMVEVSFNRIWCVEKRRSIVNRVWLYLCIAVALPVVSAVVLSVPILGVVKDVIAATMGAMSLTRWASDGLLAILDSSVFSITTTFALASLAFAFFFWVIPNCKIAFRHALYGGWLTSALFGGWLKACAVAQVGIAKSSALYGSFAFIPIVLAWMYVSWEIILLGANMVHAFGASPSEKKS